MNKARVLKFPANRIRRLTKTAPTKGELPLRALNERNRAFWREESKRIQEAIEKRPEDAKIAANMMTEQQARIKAALSDIVSEATAARLALKSAFSMEAIIEKLGQSHTARQRGAAKKRRKSDRDQCIEAYLLDCFNIARNVSWKDVERHVHTVLGVMAAKGVTASLVSRIRKKLRIRGLLR